MHDEHDVPLLSEDAARFLRAHAETGEPTADELERVRAKVLAQPAAPAPVLTLPVKPRRSLFPPEVLAVAALVAIAVVAQLVYLAFRPEIVTGATDPQLTNVVTAYRAGGLEQARLAASSCTSAACASMSSKLLRALELSGRFEKLDDAEADELARLDVELSGGVATELTKALEERRKHVALTPEALLASAQSLSAQGQYEAARDALLDAGVDRRSLVAAPPQAESPAALFRRASSLMATDPDEATRLFAQVAQQTGSNDQLHLKATAKLVELAARQRGVTDLEKARDLYLRGYQLRESQPDLALQLFQQVVERTPADDATHQKAVARIQELRETPPPENVEAETLVLRVGQSVTRDYPSLMRVALGDASVVDVKTLPGSKLRFIGASPGKTTVVLWLASGQRLSHTIEVKR